MGWWREVGSGSSQGREGSMSAFNVSSTNGGGNWMIDGGRENSPALEPACRMASCWSTNFTCEMKRLKGVEDNNEEGRKDIFLQ